MKKIENKCMLITYSDSLGKNLKQLRYILDHYFMNAIGGVHILPFFPSSGDRGFAPMDYHKVAPEFGDWNDIEELSESNIGDTANKLRYTSILKFKVLEKKNVYLVISKPSEINKYEIFVGITRTMLNLEINIVK